MRAFVVVLAMAGLAGSASAATFVVTSNADTDDKAADGKCADVNNKCTLRAAITEANRTPAADVIQFNILNNASKNIALVSNPPGFAPLPLSITTPMTIDATTQSGYAGSPVIEIDGGTLGTYGISIDARDVELRGLRIKNFQRWGISVVNASSCVIRATEVTDSQIGLEIQAGAVGAGPILVGGSVAADRNVFARNTTAISVWNGAHDVEIAGNFIGTDTTGTVAAPNASYGIYVDNASLVIHDNVISGNQVGGIELERGAGTKLVQNNKIGTDVTGAAAIPNGNGIRVRGPGAEIAGNTISGNTGVGVFLTGAQCVGTKVHGNRIGTNAGGLVALGNDYGIQIDESASGSTIGGTTPADRNVISGNYLALYMLNLQSSFDLSTQTRDHQITGNYIGPASDGTSTIGNQLAVYIYGAAHNSLTSNRIWGNASSGVAILGQNAIDNTVSQNVVAGNGGLPIDLEYDGVTPNDSFDLDIGANNHQNFPDLQVTNQGGTTQVGGALYSHNLETYTLELYKMPSCSGGAQMAEYITSATVSTNAAGNGQFLITIPTVADGTGIAATATSSSGSTSELSYCASASACVPPQIQTSLQQATVGFTYQQQLTGFFPTGALTFTVTAGALPAGMSLATDGWLTGLPTEAGTYPFTVHVADVSGCAADYALSLFVCPEIVVSPAVLPRVPPNSPVDITLTASGGTAPYQFYFQDGPEGLVPGMQLYPQGVLHGTPTSIGVYSFVIAAFDSGGCVGQRGYNFEVGCSNLYFTPSQLPLGDVGAPYDVQLTASGGVPPYRFTASQLPEGLEMSIGGHITGKPRARGLTPVTITLLDRAGCTIDLTLGLEVVVLDEPGCASTTGHGSPVLVMFVIVVLGRRRRGRAITA